MFSLGENIEERLHNITYFFREEEYKNKYLLKVYFEKLDFDKIICFGTPQSSWDYLYRLMYKKYYDNDPEPKNIEILEDISELKGKDFIEVLEDFFLKDKILKDKIIIKYFEESLEKKEMIDYIYKLRDELNNAEKIFMDLTGGQRDLPIFIIQLLNLIMQDIAKKEQDVEILYAKLKEKELFEVINLNDFIEKINYTHDISPFTKYGCPLKFKKYFKDENLKIYLDKLYIYTQYNLIQKLIEHINKFKNIKIKYPAYIQQKIIETKMEQWKNILSVKLQKDALKDYQLELFNEALAVILEGAKLEEEKNNDKNIIYDKNSNDIKELRNSIVHPFNKKNMSYNDLEKKFTKKKEKLPEILIVNVGDINYYKKVSFEEMGLKTFFSFKAILKSNKFERMFLVGTYSNVWNDFIDKWIEEDDLGIKRKNNILVENNSEENFEKILNEELENIGKKLEEKTKTKYKFEVIILNNSFTVEDRNRYFEKFVERLIKGNKKYLVTYDMTSSFRDVSFINYINLHCLELLDMLKIKKLVYISVDNTNNTAKIQDMNKITSVMSLLKSTQEFNLYNKFSDSLDVNEKLKILMKKLSRMYNFNQVTSLTSVKNEIDNFKNIENQLEEEILNNIKEKYIYNVSDKYEKAKIMVKNQLKFNNLAQALYLIWDMVLNGLVEDDKEDKKIDQRAKGDFIKKSNKYGYEELYDFYQKYKHFSTIRAESSHINFREIPVNLENISNEIEECLKELDNLMKNKEKYSKTFYKDFYKKENYV